MSIRILILTVAVLLLSAACADEDAPQQATPQPTAAVGTFADSRCATALPPGQVVENARCGAITVLEDRSNPSGGTITLPVVVLKAIGDDPAPDPLVYLSGGPGISALLSDMPAYEDWFAHAIQSRRDIVFFDQRGTGLAKPALTCPEVQAPFQASLAEPSSAQELTDRAREPNLACRERIVAEGVNLSMYNSKTIVADVVDLMAALGYEEWNLYGFSYGSRIALTAARERPAGLRSLILDSPVPLESDPGSRPAILQRAIETVIDDCLANAACGAAYPDLESEFWGVVSSLNASPVTIDARLTSGETLPVAMHGGRFVDGVYRLFGSGEYERFPSDVHALASGDSTRLAPYAAALAGRWGFIADAMLVSVICGEEVPFGTLADVESGAAGVRTEVIEGMQVSGSAYGVDPSGGAAELRETQDFCREWGVDAADAVEDLPVASDIPALVLSGQYDPGTPPENGRTVSAALSRSHYIEVPNAGHGIVFSYPLCVLKIAAEFLDAPTDEPDASCIEGVPPVAWVIE